MLIQLYDQFTNVLIYLIANLFIYKGGITIPLAINSFAGEGCSTLTKPCAYCTPAYDLTEN